jgi:hypothetical protein
VGRTSSSRWSPALAGLWLLSLASGGCTGSDKDQRPSGAGGAIPPETPMTRVEDDARKEFKAFLNDPKLDVAPEEARQNGPLAKQALDTTFAELAPALRAKLDVSRPARCLRNGCYKDVIYSDWATYYAVDQAVLFGPTQSAFARFPGAQYRTGRSPIDKDRFVVTWALMFSLKGSSK